MKFAVVLMVIASSAWAAGEPPMFMEQVKAGKLPRV
jgi:hypothetical protein